MLKRITFLTLCLACCAAVQAQSFCSSDGQPLPAALLERFVSADCEACWNSPDDAAPVPARTLVLDWIVPGKGGDDAPLSAAASRDALLRLEALALATGSSTAHSAVVMDSNRSRLRVAHGLPLADYVGASIEWTSAGAGPWTGTLLLVQEIPAGTQGTPIARHLVRNMLQIIWSAHPPAPKPERFFDSRPMNLPASTPMEQLRVVGWVQDTTGKLVTLAQSACQAAEAD
jgi:hypothetical protein